MVGLHEYRLSSYLRTYVWHVLLIIFVVFTFLVNTLHEAYPDEFDNILGGWYIIHGRLPYSGFFTHHGPIPYFIAAFITLFTGQSFVRFRILYAFFLLVTLLVTYFFLKKSLGKNLVGFFPFFVALLGIAGTYYWTHMLLADNIAALCFLPLYIVILTKALFRKTVTLFDVGSVSAVSAIGLYSSLTYTYLFLIINLSILYLYFKDRPLRRPVFRKTNMYPFLLLALPHALFVVYLVATRGFSDYLYQNVTFNAKYYIYNYPRPFESAFINPVRYGVLIANQFFINFYTLLIGVKTFDFVFPLNMTLALGNTGLFLYLLFQREYKLATFVLLVLVFTSVRSNPLNSQETDYQSAVYNFIAFFNIFFLLAELYKSINGNIQPAKKVVFGGLLLLVGVYSFFALFHLVLKFNHKTVGKYMGTAPLIYDRPRLAPVVNTLVGRHEYAWIGPFEFEELFYMNAKIPSRYHILVYGVGRSDRIRQEMISDFTKNKPIVIMFDREFSYLGRRTKTYSPHFLDLLNEHYVTLLQYREEKTVYRSVIPIHIGEKLDLEGKMYIRKDKVKEVLKKLLEANYVKSITES